MEIFDENLLTPLSSTVNSGTKDSDKSGCVTFLNQLEGWKTKCKNLHWSAPKKNIHVYLDDFADILSSYQDGLAEGYMGINGKLGSSILEGISCETDNALDFIEQVKKKTILFYEGLPKETVYKGIVSECETFIQNINKYIYLFKLCNVY